MKTKTGQIVTGLILNAMGLLYPIIETQLTDYRKQSFNLVGIMAFNIVWAVVFGVMIGAAVKECAKGVCIFQIVLAVVIILCEFFGRREMNVIYSLVVAGIYLGTLLRLCVAKQKT